uniref:Uncharacterized protein ycf33 n=1 Tax=Melanthalia intermedia TaxID=172989 RepID=A0A345UAY7_9FLOR|nr:hypothetical protein [Melanthalia intermedia]AXI97623.1 hypothetical protein [Melanthalia intermedia]
MANFWNNVKRFPRFLFSVIAGFFLTTFYPIFELLKEGNKRVFIVSLIILSITVIVVILRRMLALD